MVKMKSVQTNEKNRIYYFDVLRVIACLSIILIHSSSRFVVTDIGSKNFWIGNICDGLARIGIPIFIMISGALMLDKNYKFSKDKMIKHIKKMTIFFIFWSALYCILFNIIEPIFINHKTIKIIEIIKSFISGYYHLWFIYLIIGLYLIVPLLRLWVKDENKKYVEYFLVLSIVLTCIIPPIISIGSNFFNSFSVLNDIVEKKLQLKYIGGYTTYFILGWYLHNYEIENKKNIYLFGILGAFISILGTYIFSHITGKTLTMYGDLYINVLLQAVATFIFVKSRLLNEQNKNNKIINYISKYSLGIYAIHAMCIYILYTILILKNYNNALICIPAVFVITFIVSFVASLILGKIPFVKEIV